MNVGFIGNMKNINFAMMRCCCDLGDGGWCDIGKFQKR